MIGLGGEFGVDGCVPLLQRPDAHLSGMGASMPWTAAERPCTVVMEGMSRRIAADRIDQPSRRG
jgi:hypothetical protein